jgi:hypothetical protein
MKIVFISGKYRGKDYQEIEANIQLAKQAAIELWKQGYAVICPHLNTAHFDGFCPDEVWLEGDIEIMKRCDAVYFLNNWGQSQGSIKEHKIATDMGLELIYQ